MITKIKIWTHRIHNYIICVIESIYTPYFFNKFHYRVYHYKRSESIKDFIFGKARLNPCKKCGSPYHFTEEHTIFN